MNPQRAGNIAVKRHHKIGFADQRLRARHPLRLHGVRRLPKAGGIDQTDRPAVDIHPLLDRVARRAGLVRNDGTAFAEKGVHERALPRVRRTGQHDKRPFAQEPSLASRRHQPVDPPPQVLDIRRHLLHRAGGQLVLVEIQQVLHAARQLQRLGIERFIPVRQRAPQPRLRLVRRPVCARIDEIDHRLGGGKVELAVQEGALGELAATRQTRPGGETCFQNAPRRHAAAMALELDHVLTRIGMRPLEHQHQPAVSILKQTDKEPPGLLLADRTPRHLRGDGPGIRPAHAHHRHPSPSGRGRNGGNGVG